MMSKEHKIYAPYKITNEELSVYEDAFPEDPTTMSIARVMRDKVELWLEEDEEFCRKYGTKYADMRM